MDSYQLFDGVCLLLQPVEVQYNDDEKEEEEEEDDDDKNKKNVDEKHINGGGDNYQHKNE